MIAQFAMLRNAFSSPYTSGIERLIEQLEDRCLLSVAALAPPAPPRVSHAVPVLNFYAGAGTLINAISATTIPTAAIAAPTGAVPAAASNLFAGRSPLPSDIFGGASIETQAAVNITAVSVVDNNSATIEPPSSVITSGLILGSGGILANLNIGIVTAQSP